MLTRDQVITSKGIQRRTGRTFHAATRLLPERVREPTYVLYAFFRIADEVVDDPDPAPPGEQRRQLERLRAAALGERDPDGPDAAVTRAFATLRDRHGIPDEEVDAFIDAMAMDVDARRYETFDELRGYLRGSSVAVANMMLSVMDPDEAEAARPHAAALAEAFQLTNFVRDVREDVVEYGRIYLPRETLERHGVTDERLRELRFSERVGAAIREELERAESLYCEGVAGIRYLPEDCRFAVLAAATLYAEHHRLIRGRGFDVVSARPSLGVARRAWVIARTWWHYRRSGDPVETFEAVSPVPADGGSAGGASLRSPGGWGVARPARWLAERVGGWSAE